MSEWNKFKVGKQALSGFANNCRPFKTVRHVSHVEGAISIIQSRQIRPGLVFDESKLNDKRILVAWASPNYWNPGFRYGTVEFEFAIDELIDGKNFYWVESIAYNTEACRILITEADRSDELEEYDPEAGDGPWWYEDDEVHYYNGNYCLELMIEEPISLEILAAFGFVSHHNDHCSIHRTAPDNCVELGLTDSEGAALFLAAAVSRRLDLTDLGHFLFTDEGKAGGMLKAAFGHYWRRICKDSKFECAIRSTWKDAPSLARAILSAYACKDIADARQLATHFCGPDDLYEALANEVAERLGLKEPKSLMG